MTTRIGTQRLLPFVIPGPARRSIFLRTDIFRPLVHTHGRIAARTFRVGIASLAQKGGQPPALARTIAALHHL